MSDSITSATPAAASQAERITTISRVRSIIRRPSILLGIILLALLSILVVVPLGRLLTETLTTDGQTAWSQVLTGRLAQNLFWEPLANTLAISAVVAVGTVLVGGALAWIVVMTDTPGRRLIGALASIPLALPSFAIALAWETIFRNDLIGGRVGLLQSLGVPIPDWLAWGFVPIAATLIAQGFAFAFVLISAALATVNTELWEAAEMTGAPRRRILRDIILPIVFPAVVSSGLLAFAEAVSNFAAPALLGLPVRFHTISTRLYGSISTGQVERGYVLAILLIVIAAAILWVSTRLTSGRRSFATITGKGGRRTILRSGALRRPLCVIAVIFLIATTVVPLLALLASSFARRTNDLTNGLTDHFWLGASDPAFAQGQEGVLRNPQVVDAALNTLVLGLLAALAATVLGLAIGYVIARSKAKPLSGAIGVLSYLPFLIPGVAFGAIYIAQFGTPMGPMPALYGTFLLLVIASAIYNLPFAAQAGRTAVGQISGELEEAAIMTGASFPRRLIDIFVPLSARGLIAGALLVFVNTVRELALVVLLAPLTLPLLSIITFRYASDGFAQFANAITVIIVLICVVATLAARRLQGASQPWSER